MSDENYIKLTIELAERGLGKVSPNPLVGAVIVKNDRIIGKGFHEKFGEPHAEINAINNSSENPEGATLYVNLEPCSHFGKTPPCADEIIRRKISRVVIGNQDPNPLVNGLGIKKLKDAGIDVSIGVLEEECRNLNKFFFKNVNSKLPFVTLKIAQTIDGKIADSTGNSKWISSEASRKLVHEMRSYYDAVLVGSKTVLTDNPELNVRLVEGKDPIKIIIDKNLELNSDLKVFKNPDKKRVIVVTSEKYQSKEEKITNFVSGNIELIFIKEKNGKLDLSDLLKKLYQKNISSVLVEGGRKIFSSFIRKKLFDEIRLFIGPKVLGSGIPGIENIGIENISDSLELVLADVKKIDNDALLIYRSK